MGLQVLELELFTFHGCYTCLFADVSSAFSVVCLVGWLVVVVVVVVVIVVVVCVCCGCCCERQGK